MMNNPMQMMQAFMNFKQNFTGDPQAEVAKLLQSGKLSQGQLNELQKMAAQFQNMMNNFR